jgi:3-phosphoshikimate 1-carboxyvinyltransferase
VTAQTVRRPARLRGTIRVPGHKSISHRAALLGALTTGTTRARRFLTSEDCLATLDCLRALGVEWRLIDEPSGTTLEVDGAGLHGLGEPEDVLDCRNSGTTMRIIAGILAGQPFTSVLTGDASLRARPVDRVIEPLRLMGAHVLGRQHDRLPPLTIRGGALHGIRYRQPVASAQVKSAVLLAGLFADGETVVEEPGPSRDHTERMLTAMGADVRREGPAVSVRPVDALSAIDIEVPGDISSAAYWLVAAAAHPDAEVALPNVGINPTRTGLLDALAMMGVSLDVGEERMAGEEPVADLAVRSSRLHGIEAGGELVLRMMDELPVLAVAAALAEGETVVRDAQELRVKESDRIASLARELRKLGVAIEERDDGFAVQGGRPMRGARVSGSGDHRLTMALAVAGLLAEGETIIEDGESVAVSYPGFWTDIAAVTEG